MTMTRTSEATQTAPLGGAAKTTLADRFRRMRYAGSGSRDMRIDLLRGLAIIVMVSNHLSARSYINAFTQGRVYVSAAEGFVFLAGYVLGMVSLGRQRKVGLAAANRQLLSRAFTLYKASFFCLAVAASITLFRPGWASPVLDELAAPFWRVLVAGALFHMEPRLIDILQLYVICIAASPGLLWLLDRGYRVPILVGSASLWLLNQLHPYALCFSPVGREHPYFDFPSWQVLYVFGFVIGYHADQFKAQMRRVPRLAIVLVALPVVVAAATAAHYDVDLGAWPETITNRARWLALTDRSLMGAIRIVAICALFPLLFLLVDAFWRPLNALVGPVFVTLGQNSLYVFLVHIPFAVAWHFFPAIASRPPLATLGQIAIVLCLWQLTKRQVLFGVIPR